MSDSLQAYGPSPARLLCPRDSLGKNTGVGCDTLLQGIFLTQGSNLYLSSLMSPAMAGRFFTTSATLEAQFLVIQNIWKGFTKLDGLIKQKLLPI